MVVVATGIFGTLIGATAGYFPRLDNPIMRLMDAFMAFPPILLAITVSAVLGASVTNVIIALSVATTPHTARIVRASVLVVRELEYVEAARALGASDARVLFRHVLVNALGPLIVRLTYVFAIAILAEAALSFIGVGPPPPAPSFGSIIAQGRDFMAKRPGSPSFRAWRSSFSVLGLNLLGDGLRDVLDPRMKVMSAMSALLAGRRAERRRSPRSGVRSSTTSRLRSSRARCSASSASRAPARACWRSPSWACCRARSRADGGPHRPRRRGSARARPRPGGRGAGATSR